MIPIDFIYIFQGTKLLPSMNQIVREILDYVLGALNHQPINFFIIFRWYIPSINPWKSTDKSGRIRMMSPRIVTWHRHYPHIHHHSMNSMISLWYNGYIVIHGNFSKYLPYLPYNLYPILGTAGPRVIVWPRHPASMRRFFFRPARENPPALGFIAPEMGFSLWLWLTVRHGIDGPNRNGWFTELKNGDFPWLCHK